MSPAAQIEAVLRAAELVKTVPSSDRHQTFCNCIAAMGLAITDIATLNTLTIVMKPDQAH